MPYKPIHLRRLSFPFLDLDQIMILYIPCTLNLRVALIKNVR